MANYSTQQFGESFSSDPFVSSLFQPDVMLPSQFQEDAERGFTGGERKLMAAILADGVEAYISKSLSAKVSKSKANNEAMEWIETTDTNYPFSFDNVCFSLGIDANYLRLGLARYVKLIRGQQQGGAELNTYWKKIRRPRK
ncbi:MAG: hypothetical protein IT292_06390 [Deltaproteobacteria bacterium]|nr:hypothetical protein [Deltaproteobacteria bacterium]